MLGLFLLLVLVLGGLTAFALWALSPKRGEVDYDRDPPPPGEQTRW